MKLKRSGSEDKAIIKEIFASYRIRPLDFWSSVNSISDISRSERQRMFRNNGYINFDNKIWLRISKRCYSIPKQVFNEEELNEIN